MAQNGLKLYRLGRRKFGLGACDGVADGIVVPGLAVAGLVRLLSRFGARSHLNIRVRDLVKSHRSIPNRGLVWSKGLGLQIGSQNTGAGSVGAGADIVPPG